MLIHYLNLLRLGFLPTVLIVRAFPERANCTYDGYLRMLCLHSFYEETVTLHEGIAQHILIAYAEILQVERLWMACLSSHRRKRRLLCIAVSPLYQVKQLLQIRLHRKILTHILIWRRFASKVFQEWYATLLTVLRSSLIASAATVLARHTGSKHRYRLRTDVLTELEILIEAQSACLVVMPDIVVTLPLPQVSDGGLPMVYVVDTVAMRCTSAREADEARLQISDSLSEILAQSVAATLVSILWKERHEVQIQLSPLLWFYHQLCRLGICRSLERYALPAPLLSCLESG